MKKALLIAICVAFFAGCNESKEGRIQKLEAEAEKAASKSQELERRVQKLESQTTAQAND